MSQPTEQFAELRQGAGAHERRIAELRDVIRLAQEEIGLHEALLEVSRDNHIEETITQFRDDPSLISGFAEDPLGFCGEHEISFPQGLTLIAAQVTDEPSTRITAYFSYGDWNVEAVWDLEQGFNARPRRNYFSSRPPKRLSSNLYVR
jgi:hypothetical protein